MYGNAFEAFIGAIYLDQDYDRCKQYMEENNDGLWWIPDELK